MCRHRPGAAIRPGFRWLSDFELQDAAGELIGDSPRKFHLASDGGMEMSFVQGSGLPASSSVSRAVAMLLRTRLEEHVAAVKGEIDASDEFAN